MDNRPIDFDAARIDVALVEALIAEQFPQWAELPVKPVAVSGWDNRTFHLGSDMSVRLPSGVGYVPQVEKEQRWLPELAPDLPLPIPTPVGKGQPGQGYPWVWSVYRWVEGNAVTRDSVMDSSRFASDLAGFLKALQAIDARDGPAAGAHNFHRGGDLAVYEAETLRAIESLSDELDVPEVTEVWQAAMASKWQGDPVWVHGDVAIGNVLQMDGCLSAVIDFGSSGVGDPACDLVMAWTFFDAESRAVFQTALPLGRDTWGRARGWALWKALITIVQHKAENPKLADEARAVVDTILADFAAISR